MISATGWTFEYIENELTIRRLAMLLKYWNENPPAHIMLGQIRQAIFGMCGIEKEKRVEDDPATFEEFLSVVGAKLPPMKG